MVGGATFLAIAPKAGWVTANLAKPGNRLLVTKTAALEATAILSNTFPEIAERRSAISGNVFERIAVASSAAVLVTRSRFPGFARFAVTQPAFGAIARNVAPPTIG